MLLYEEGAMFKPHKGTEKEPGMFATLVICLPSEFTGGAVVTSHGKQSKVVEPELPTFFHSYVSWYADVTHEVKPIESGYRLVLVYNLINVSREIEPSASLALGDRRELCGILKSWDRGTKKVNRQAPNMLLYQLDHQYTDANLSFGALKGLDRVKGEHLRETCNSANACLYLANLEYSKSGDVEDTGYDNYYGRGNYDDYDENDNEPGYGGGSGNHHILEYVHAANGSLKRMVDLEGHLLAQDLPLNEEAIIQGDPFERDPDREDYEGYTGNDGPSATQWYRDTVIVLIPLSRRRNLLAQALINGCVDSDTWIRNMIQFVEQQPENTFAKADLYELSCSVLDKTAGSLATHGSLPVRRCATERFPSPGASLPVKASILLRHRQLFEEALKGLYDISSRLLEDVGSAMFLLEITLTHPSINQLLDRFITFHGRFTAIRYIKNGFLRAAIAGGSVDRQIEILNWASTRSRDALVLLNSVVREDGICLAKMAIQEPGGISTDEAIAIAKRYTPHPAFLVAFTTSLLTAAETGNAFAAATDQVCSEMLRVIADTFSVECRASSKRPAPGTAPDSSPIECLMHGLEVDVLLHYLYTKGLNDQYMSVYVKLVYEASGCDLVAFDAFYFPLLSALIIRQTRENGLRKIHRTLFRGILSLYVKRYVQVEPLAGTWARDPEGCGRSCHDCDSLDNFLMDPTLMSKRFPVPSNRRHHLHSMLNQTGHKHETERGRVETLVVTKRTGAADRKHERWRKRFSVAQEKISTLDQEALKELLGEEYEGVMQLRADAMEWSEARWKALKRKLKPEVIDLT